MLQNVPQKKSSGGEAKVGCRGFWATLPGTGPMYAPNGKMQHFSWVGWPGYRSCGLILYDFFDFPPIQKTELFALGDKKVSSGYRDGL